MLGYVIENFDSEKDVVFYRPSSFSNSKVLSTKHKINDLLGSMYKEIFTLNLFQACSSLVNDIADSVQRNGC